ncbi:hypothetical protein, partial [Pseudomonas viridiflava]|uniref:hypothetical protein n=1 Tax=Pseudomonas viridiflava TaxID=33069 RepID=UPI00198183D0
DIDSSMHTSEDLFFKPEVRIVIDHPLIYNLITYGDGSALKLPIGNWNSWSFGARGILTWLVMEALKVRRYPWHPDACQANAPHRPESEEVFKVLEEHLPSPQAVQDAVDEILRIYEHTQSVFAEQGRRTVTLHRSLHDGPEGYASQILSMAEASKDLDLDHFQLSTNILSSWSEAAGYAGYPVTIQVEHPVENVIWGSDVIASNGFNPMQSAVESEEWIVVNRALDGRLRVPVKGVVSKSIPEKWVSMHRHSYAPSYSNGKTKQEHARIYLDKQQRVLAPLQGSSLPFHHSGVLHLRWCDRFKLAMRLLTLR